MKNKIKLLFSRGFFYIAGTNVVNKAITMLTNILIARFLGKHEYGVFGAAYNVYSIFIIFSGFGMNTAILLFCSEKRDDKEKQKLYRYGLISGFIASVFLSIGMFIYAVCFPLGISETRGYIILLSLLPLVDYIMQYFLIILRTQKQNKLYAFMLNISSVTYFLFGCLGAQIFSVTGTIIGRYISYFIVIFICYRKISNYFFDGNGEGKIGKELKKSLWSYSLKNGASSAFNQMLYLIDIALIATILQNAEIVASYKVAVLLPEGLAFIPTSVMIFLVPVIAEHNDDVIWLKKNLKVLFCSTGAMNCIISVFLLIFAPQIIGILWGETYLDSVPCFRLLSLNYFVMATFRMSCTNILAVLRKVNFNLILGIISGILNIILDLVLICNLGSIGAAWATLITVAFISVISFPYLIYSISMMSKK